MTIKELSELTGFSPSTISKALNGSYEISPETIARITQLADQTGYTAKRQQRRQSQRFQPTPTIGVIISSADSDYYRRMTWMFCDAIEAKGAVMLMTRGHSDMAELQKRINVMLAANVDGLVLVDTINDIDALLFRDVPPVIITSEPQTFRFNSILVDFEQGIRQAIEYLISLGHTRIAFLSSDGVKMKPLIFRRVIGDYASKLSYSTIITNNVPDFRQIGAESFNRILQIPEQPTGVIAYCDDVALDFIAAAQQYGKQIPTDYSVIGCDDVPQTQSLGLPLTSITVHMQELCDISVSILMKKIKDPLTAARQNVTINTSLKIRQTTAPPPTT